MPQADEPYRVLIVCTGNTCRSPMAAQVLRSHPATAGLAEHVEVASSGLRVNSVGASADPRAEAALAAAGYPVPQHAARQFAVEMLGEYQLIITLSSQHAEILQQVAPTGSTARIALLRTYDPDAPADDQDVPDPFRGDSRDYARTPQLIEAAMPGLTAAIGTEVGTTAC